MFAFEHASKWPAALCLAAAFAQPGLAQTPPSPSALPSPASPAATQNPAKTAPVPPASEQPAAPVAEPTTAITNPEIVSAEVVENAPAHPQYRYQKIFWPIAYPAILPTGPGYYSAADAFRGNYRDGPPKGGYPRIFATPTGFFDVDFSYVDAPGYEPTWSERLHRIHLGNDWMFGTGGEYRNRYDSEGNARLTGKQNAFDLNRVRVFGEVWYKDIIRVYAEFITAQTTAQTLPPLITDRQYADILNLFVDVKAFTFMDEGVYVRGGRQQILLGSQRIISPGDWGNTLRTFDGVRTYRRSENFEVDAFWLRPVVPNSTAMAAQDVSTNFAGVYTTYRGSPNRILDMYWLYLDNQNSAAGSKLVDVGPLQANSPYYVNTLGFRSAGKAYGGKFLWDFENMLQMGQGKAGNLLAGNTSSGVGYNFNNVAWNPTFWAYYDYATGSDKVAGKNTYNQLFPLGHYYLGWMDYVGRANLQDANFHMYLYPSKWITFNTQYHIFQLANAKDALYNTNAAVLRSDPTGKAGTNVGSELDFVVNWHLSSHSDVVTAYGHFFAGEFLTKTGPTNDLNTVWLIYNFRW